jgi:hypothetical protein
MAKPQVAPRVQPRVYPAGRSVVFHGFGVPELAGRRFTIDGRRMQALRFGRLALLVSFVDATAFAPEEVERQRCDVDWSAREARLHERAIGRALAHGTFVPARFLSVFAHPLALEEAAAEHYARWCRSLTRLGGKREFALHVYAGPHAALGGDPYILRVAAHASRSMRIALPKVDDAIVAALKELLSGCSAIATAVRRVEGVPARGLLGSSVYLIPEADGDVLRMLVSKASLSGAARGLTYYLEGPRAPFSFT